VFNIIVVSVGLLIGVLDRLGSLTEKSEDTIKESNSFINSSIIPLGALALAGYVFYEVKRKK
jgi:hypothetical protein